AVHDRRRQQLLQRDRADDQDQRASRHRIASSDANRFRRERRSCRTRRYRCGRRSAVRSAARRVLGHAHVGRDRRRGRGAGDTRGWIGLMIARAGQLATPLTYIRTMAVFVAVWWALSVWTANTALLPSPFAVIAAFVELAADLELFKHAAISLTRMLVSIA